MSTFFRSAVQTYIENWNPALYRESVATQLLPMPNEWVNALLDCNTINLESGYIPTDENDRALKEITAAIDVQLKQFRNGAFVRLGSRSPKDAYVTQNGMKCTEGKLAVQILLDSERISDDLSIAKYNTYTPHVAIRDWINIQPWQEFRCFYKDGKLLGVSQYDYFKGYMPEIEENISGIMMALEIKTERIAKHLPYDGTVIVDYVYRCKNRGNEVLNETILLEINPWTILTDPCLFDWNNDQFTELEFRFIGKDKETIIIPWHFNDRSSHLTKSFLGGTRMANSLDKVIWKTTFTWEDVLTCMSEEERSKFESLPEERKKKLIEKHEHSIGKGLESGIMFDWTAVMETAVRNSGLLDDLEAIQNNKICF